jgi:hypothetical protein
MEYTVLGRTGLRVSRVGCGGGGIGQVWGPTTETESGRALHRARELGVNFFHVAPGYGHGKAVETVLSMLTLITHFKKVMPRVGAYFQARLAFTMAAFTVLVQWHGFLPNASGFVPLSMAELSLSETNTIG